MTELRAKNQVFATVSIALIHFVVTFALLFSSFRGGRFDRGVPRSLLEEIQAGILYVLMFPLMNPVSRLLPSLPIVLDYGIAVLNSLIWGIATLWVFNRWRRMSASD